MSDKQKYYIVYDGRAIYDEDDATVVECVGKSTSDEAIKQFKNDWADCGCVLFEYDIDDEDSLINGVMVQSWIDEE